jgi:hypothetical protein
MDDLEYNDRANDCIKKDGCSGGTPEVPKQEADDHNKSEGDQWGPYTWSAFELLVVGSDAVIAAGTRYDCVALIVG